MRNPRWLEVLQRRGDKGHIVVTDSGVRDEANTSRRNRAALDTESGELGHDLTRLRMIERDDICLARGGVITGLRK